MSASDAIADFLAFMESSGVQPIEPIAQRLASGSLIRFRCEGDGKGRQNGWAILYLDERPAGAFGNYRLNTGTLKWKAASDRPALSKAERDALQAEWKQARERRDGERENNEREAALAAGDLWQRASRASKEHPYIVAKQILSGPLRQLGEELLVSMFADDGNLWNIQRIRPDGSKRFLKGGRVDDLFMIIGAITSETRQAAIAEGYATGDAVFQALAIPTIVAFSAKNMIRVARLFHEWRPDIDYTIFADDDEKTAQDNLARFGRYENPGVDAAQTAAAEIGASIAYPSSWWERQGRAA